MMYGSSALVGGWVAEVQDAPTLEVSIPAGVPPNAMVTKRALDIEAVTIKENFLSRMCGQQNGFCAIIKSTRESALLFARQRFR